MTDYRAVEHAIDNLRDKIADHDGPTDTYLQCDNALIHLLTLLNIDHLTGKPLNFDEDDVIVKRTLLQEATYHVDEFNEWCGLCDGKTTNYNSEGHRSFCPLYMESTDD